MPQPKQKPAEGDQAETTTDDVEALKAQLAEVIAEKEQLLKEREELIASRDDLAEQHQATAAALDEAIASRDDLADHLDGDAAERPVTEFDKYGNWTDPFSGLVVAEGTFVSPRTGARLVKTEDGHVAVMEPHARGLEQER